MMALPAQPRRSRGRGGAPWVMTLADLALVLLGFAMLLHATADLDAADRDRVVSGIRSAFSDDKADVEGQAPAADRLPVDINVMTGFHPGDATLPAPPAALVAWLRDVTTDPRSRVVVAGRADGSAADVDQASGSSTILAARRAEAVAAAITRAGVVPADRLTITTLPPAATATPANRRAELSVTFDR
jgi:outer membrane protein OmpA-like peptidoglycan-associated protein